MVIALSLFVVLLQASDPVTPVRLSHTPDDARAVAEWVGRNLPRLESFYRDVHAHPELSLAESRTADLLAEGLRAAGYEVTTGIGGHGVVGLLRQGAGPTLLIRGDMDALPVIEETSLPYASTVRVTRPDGSTVGVMHACGHDVHTTALLGTAQLLAELRSRWSGTLLIVGQPAEEIGRGARAMLDDGLFERFPRPDFCIAEHVSANLPAGQIGHAAGWCFANVDSVDITIHGRSGHGARPQETVDPIVTAAYLITQLQTLVSRRVSPVDPAVVTVGSIHGGSKHNIIPGEVKLQLTVRSYTDEVRTLLLDGIRQMANDTCLSFRCPQPPEVLVLDEHTPASWNDPALTATAAKLFADAFGADQVIDMPPEMGGEDFGLFAKTAGAASFMFRVGAVDPELWKASLAPGGPPLPPIHSGRFAPLPGPTLQAAITALANLALGLLE